MKVTIEFTDTRDAEVAFRSRDITCAIHDFTEEVLRRELKYGNTYDKNTLEWVRDEFYKCFNERSIDIERITE